MSPLLLTIIIAIVFFLLAFAALAIGRILTGKSKLRMCGSEAKKQRDKDCGKDISCPLCAPTKSEKRKKGENNDSDSDSSSDK